MKRDAIFGRLFVVAAIVGLLPFGAGFWWGFELLTHFKVQFVVAGLILAGLALAVKRHRLALVILVIAALNIQPLLAYLPTASLVSSDAASITAGLQFDVLTINVEARNRGFPAIVEAVRAADADLVAIVELSPELDSTLTSLANRYPHRFSAPASSNFGIGILSRYPLRGATEIPSGPTSAIESIVELPGGPIRFIAVHLFPPIGQRMADIRNRQLDQLATYANGIEEPLLICGDFNLSPYSPFFAHFTATAGLRDVRLGQGLGFSWPSFFPPAGIPIDHCLIRGPLVVESIKRLDRFGSDHYPVQVSLVWQEDE